MRIDDYGDESRQNVERHEEASRGRWDPDMVAFKPGELEARISPGMKVEDRAGNGIGKVAAVYSPIGVNEFNADPYNVYVKVDQGLLGSDQYIPARFIGQIRGDTVRVTIKKGEMNELDWHKPEWTPD